MAGDPTLFAREDYVEEAVAHSGSGAQELELLLCWNMIREIHGDLMPSKRLSLLPVAGLFRTRSFIHRKQNEDSNSFSNADAVAQAAAQFIASEARASVEARGRFIMAVSGGKTPWQMLRGPRG